MLSGYLKKLIPRGDARRASAQDRLLIFFEALNERDWREFVGDVVDARPAAYEVLGPGKGEDLLAVAMTQLRRLGLATQRQAGSAVQKLLASRLLAAAGKKGRSLRPLHDLLHVAGLIPESVHPSTLLQIVLSRKLAGEIRLAAAKALANRADELPLELWFRIEAVALPDLPELAQPVISGLGARFPGEALALLTRLETPLARPELLESPLRLVFRKLLAASDGLDEVARHLESAREWSRHLMTRVLQFEEFSRTLPNLRRADRRPIENVVSESLDAYRNAGDIDHRRLDAALALVIQAPSIAAFSSLLGFFESLLIDADLRPPPIAEAEIDRILRRVLESLGKMPAVIRGLMASSTEPERSIWLAYRRSLHIALRRRSIAEAAFDQLVSHNFETTEICRAVLLALHQAHFPAVLCRSVLMRYMPSDESAAIFAGVRASLAGMPRDLDTFSVQAKLHDLELPRTYHRWAREVTQAGVDL
jgi:hypothetical protein